MPSILSRFKRSPSTSTSSSSDKRDRRSSTVSSSHSHISSDDETVLSPSVARPPFADSGSSFVEEFDEPMQSPSKKHKPPPLAVSGGPTDRMVVGTPKLVLTEEGSNSPRSFASSPPMGGSPAPMRAERGVGLGIGASTAPAVGSIVNEDDVETPMPVNTAPPVMNGIPIGQVTVPPDAISLASTADTRERSNSVHSAHSAGTRATRPESLAQSGKSNVSPAVPGSSLFPVDKRSTKSKMSKKKRRGLSGSSGVSGAGSTIAAALAKTGLHIASPTEGDLYGKRYIGKTRSPHLVRGGADGEGEGEYEMEDDDEEDEDASDSDPEEHLPVTGFAVASNKRQADFHALFTSVDEGDYLIEDYGCALNKDILVQGRLYVSENHLCFHANIFGWVTDVVIAFTDIKTIEKKMTALVIPNAIGIYTHDAKYTFASFLSRDTTWDVMMNIWRLCNPNAVMSTTSLHQGGSRPASIRGDDVGAGGAVAAGAPPSGGKGHAPTVCACVAKHYSETALETTFPSTPEKVYNLMFTSEWVKTFLTDDQKLRELEMSDWKPDEAKRLARTMSYIKPLNGSIGPKQTKCNITDEQEHLDLDQYISMLTTTKTPDVPSGGVFSVKTRTCLTWAGANSTKVVVTTTVEWTGKSWVKGIIEKSAIDGQKTYHDDLESGMRAYIKAHAEEFAAADGVEDDPTPVVDGTKASEPTEAEAYAAQQRQKRLDKDYTYMQGAIDTIASGLRSVGSGVKWLAESTGDVLNDLPIGKELVVGGVIGLLVVSNIYTYMSKPTSDPNSRRVKRMGGKGEGPLGDEEVEEALKLVLANVPLPPAEEARELERMLDEVEWRAARLRGTIKSAAHGEGGTIKSAAHGEGGTIKSAAHGDGGTSGSLADLD